VKRLYSLKRAQRRDFTHRCCQGYSRDVSFPQLLSVTSGEKQKNEVEIFFGVIAVVAVLILVGAAFISKS